MGGVKQRGALSLLGSPICVNGTDRIPRRLRSGAGSGAGKLTESKANFWLYRQHLIDRTGEAPVDCADEPAAQSVRIWRFLASQNRDEVVKKYSSTLLRYRCARREGSRRDAKTTEKRDTNRDSRWVKRINRLSAAWDHQARRFPLFSAFPGEISRTWLHQFVNN